MILGYIFFKNDQFYDEYYVETSAYAWPLVIVIHSVVCANDLTNVLFGQRLGHAKQDVYATGCII